MTLRDEPLDCGARKGRQPGGQKLVQSTAGVIGLGREMNTAIGRRVQPWLGRPRRRRALVQQPQHDQTDGNDDQGEKLRR